MRFLWFMYCYVIAKIKAKYFGWDWELAYISMQFKEYKSAKMFCYIWYKRYDQELPFMGICGMRAMSAVVSDILEGFTKESGRLYWDTKYGTAMYVAMMGDIDQ